MKINVDTALHQNDVIELLKNQTEPTYEFLGLLVGTRTTLQFNVDDDYEVPEDYDDIFEYTKALIKKEPWSVGMQVHVTKALF